MNDLLAGFITLLVASGYVQLFNELGKRNVVDKKLSRKLVHIGVGLSFLLLWPLFTPSWKAPYFAALAPAANGLKVFAIGLGLLKDDGAVQSMTRNGDPKELLKGPFYYTLTMSITTIGFWRTSPVGIVALINLCVGDGFADIIGRSLGGSKLPYNKNKTYAGSLGFFILSSLVSVLYLSYFSVFGCVRMLPGTVAVAVVISFLCAVVEALPISTTLDDNFTVPLTAITLGMLLFPNS